jgi:hypothetical protein
MLIDWMQYELYEYEELSHIEVVNEEKCIIQILNQKNIIHLKNIN